MVIALVRLKFFFFIFPTNGTTTSHPKNTLTIIYIKKKFKKNFLVCLKKILDLKFYPKTPLYRFRFHFPIFFFFFDKL